LSGKRGRKQVCEEEGEKKEVSSMLEIIKTNDEPTTKEIRSEGRIEFLGRRRRRKKERAGKIGG